MSQFSKTYVFHLFQGGVMGISIEVRESLKMLDHEGDHTIDAMDFLSARMFILNFVLKTIVIEVILLFS